MLASVAPAPAPTAHRLLTVAEVAAELRVSRAQCYVLVSRGDIPSLRIGRLRRVTTADLVAFVASLREA
jgi:excisionase family DNA binding protein